MKGKLIHLFIFSFSAYSDTMTLILEIYNTVLFASQRLLQLAITNHFVTLSHSFHTHFVFIFISNIFLLISLFAEFQG